MAVDDSAIRRKLASAKAEAQDGGPGADRSWRVALARAARDELKLPLDVRALALGRAPVGWLVIWSDAPVQFHALPAPRGELLLMPSTDARVRIVVL